MKLSSDKGKCLTWRSEFSVMYAAALSTALGMKPPGGQPDAHVSYCAWPAIGIIAIAAAAIVVSLNVMLFLPLCPFRALFALRQPPQLVRTPPRTPHRSNLNHPLCQIKGNTIDLAMIAFSPSFSLYP